MGIRHVFVSSKPQSSDATLVSKNEWNADHEGDYVSGPPGSGTLILSGLASSIDAYPSSPSAYDDEFDAALNGWTQLGTLDVAESNVIPSHLHLRQVASTAYTVWGVYKAVPDFPFTITAKFSDFAFYQNYQACGLLLAEASPGKLASFGSVFVNGGVYWSWYTWTSRTGGRSGYDDLGGNRIRPYARAVVVAHKDVTWLNSDNGYVWTPVHPGVNPGFTIGNMGIEINTHDTASNTLELAVDWFRVSMPPYKDGIPVMTSATAPSGVASEESYYGGTYAGWCAMGYGGSGVGWICASGHMPTWIKYQFPTATTVVAYGIRPWFTDTYPGRTPKTWVFQGSNNDSTWTDLDSHTNWVSPDSWETFDFTIASPASYTYYRMYITANNGDSYTGLGRIQMYVAR